MRSFDVALPPAKSDCSVCSKLCELSFRVPQDLSCRSLNTEVCHRLDTSLCAAAAHAPKGFAISGASGLLLRAFA